MKNKENINNPQEENRMRMRTAKANVIRMQKKIRSVVPEPKVSIPTSVGKWQTTEEMLANPTE